MISQFFILSPRGDIIILRDYLANVPKVWRRRPVPAVSRLGAVSVSVLSVNSTQRQSQRMDIFEFVH